MTAKPSQEPIRGSLPAKHFAILFEGAWIFSPDTTDPKHERILATCPVPDNGMHKYEFGLWNQKPKLRRVDGFDTVDMPPNSSFQVKVLSNIQNTEDTFEDLFDTAAATYPFVYLPGKNHPGKTKASSPSFAIRKDVADVSRSVSIPLPTSVRAAGALLTAEVAGMGKGLLSDGASRVKRPFVTFVFIYEYESTFAAEVSVDNMQGAITADCNPTPHLIFRVFPDSEAMKQAGSTHGHIHLDLSDDSGEKLHATTIFDITRRALVSRDATSVVPNGTCCDIAIYHDPNIMEFDIGDTGMDREELGLPDPPGLKRGFKFPACAGGGMVSGDKGP